MLLNFTIFSFYESHFHFIEIVILQEISLVPKVFQSDAIPKKILSLAARAMKTEAMN